MNLEQNNTLPEVGRKFTFWVVYDTTGDRQFIKMDSDTGCLTMFDTEKSAAAFASGIVGVDYKEVVLYSCPQLALAEALKSAKNLIANHSGEVLPDEYAGDQIEQIDAVLAAYRKGGET